MGTRKAIDKNSKGVDVFRFAWGLDTNVSVFNKEKDFLHIAEANETKVAMIEGDKKIAAKSPQNLGAVRGS